MRKYLLLSAAGFLGFGALSFIYAHGESQLVKTNQEILNYFSAAREENSSLEKEVLKARSFLLQNYDSIVSSEEKLNQICQELDGRFGSQVYFASTKLLANQYCDAIKKKIEAVELFKSRNAVLKNSIYFVHNLSWNPKLNSASHVWSDFAERRLIRATIAYYLVSSNEAQAFLSQLLNRPEKVPAESRDEYALVFAHANKILKNKLEIDSLVDVIVDPASEALAQKLESSYFAAYEQAEKSASIYRQVLFGSCLLLLLFITYNIIQLWKAAQSLTEANSNLEFRVQQRTEELQRSQSMIAQQQQALIGSAKMSALGEMAGGIAHEINNPLAVIKSISSQMTEILSENESEKDLLKEMSETVEKTADRIAKIVHGLRVFSRDATADNFQLVSVKKLFEETASLCRERFKNHNIELIVDEPQTPLTFEGQDIQVSQVLLNLLNNAHDAISNRKEKWVRLSAVDKGETVEIQVTDCGDGIPLEIQKKIFQPFFTTKEVGKGTGLGLSISHGIIKSHHGELSIDNSCANTRFVLQLPKTRFESSKAA